MKTELDQKSNLTFNDIQEDKRPIKLSIIERILGGTAIAWVGLALLVSLLVILPLLIAGALIAPLIRET